MKKIIILFIILNITIGCSKKELKKETVKKTKVVKVVKNKYTELKSFKYEGRDFDFKKISINIPNQFISKENDTFFMDNGINLTFASDQIDGKIEDYVDSIYDKLKKRYVKIIKDYEIVLINKKEVVLMKYVLDRKKYFIEIYSVILQDKNNIYIINISGKKKDMVRNNELIIGMFSSIKLKNDSENIIKK